MTAPAAPIPKVNPKIIIGAAFLMTTISSGLIFGWTGLALVLQRRGVYNELCNGQFVDGTCEERELAYSLLFQWGSVGAIIAGFFCGFALDRFGPKITAAFFLAGQSAGLVMLAFETRLTIAAVLIGAGGTGSHIPLQNAANLFPTRISTIMALFSVLYGLSSSIFPVYDLLNSTLGITLTTCALTHAALEVGFIIAGVTVFWPNTPYQHPEQLEEPVKEEKEDKNEESKKISSKIVIRENLSKDTLKEVYFSGAYIGAALCLAIGLLRWNFYLATVDLQLEAMGNGEDTTGWTRTAGWVFATVGLPLAPAVGLYMDSHPFSTSYELMLAGSVAHMVLTLIPSLPLQLLSFVLYSVFRSTMFALFYSHIAQYNPLWYGRIAAVGLLLSGAATFLQTPALAFVFDVTGGSFFLVNVLMLLALIPPMILAIVSLRRAGRAPPPAVGDEPSKVKDSATEQEQE